MENLKYTIWKTPANKSSTSIAAFQSRVDAELFLRLCKIKDKDSTYEIKEQ